jgi:phospholipid-binding lipoprotein MlaA
MLAAHLALAALTAAPADEGVVAAPFAVADALEKELPAEGLRQNFDISADAKLFSLATPPPPGGEIPGFRYFVSGYAEASSEQAEPLGDLTVPATGNIKPDPAASLDDIDLAAPQGFSDPLEPINRISYAISQPIDRFIIRPASVVYKTIIPKPVRDGARNAISNFGEPIVILNDLVQLRPGRAIRTLGRFMINTIFGFGGLIDVAKKKPFNIAHRNNNFGDTLGFYGVGPIIYVYLPVLGPTTLRDSAGGYGDSYFLDRNLHKLIHPNSRSPYFRTKPRLGQSGTIITVVSGLDTRVESDEDLKHITEDSVDPYAALRANYLQDRAGEIAELRAKAGEAPTTEGFDDPLVDPGAKP